MNNKHSVNTKLKFLNKHDHDIIINDRSELTICLVRIESHL